MTWRRTAASCCVYGRARAISPARPGWEVGEHSRREKKYDCIPGLFGEVERPVEGVRVDVSPRLEPSLRRGGGGGGGGFRSTAAAYLQCRRHVRSVRSAAGCLPTAGHRASSIGADSSLNRKGVGGTGRRHGQPGQVLLQLAYTTLFGPSRHLFMPSGRLPVPGRVRVFIASICSSAVVKRPQFPVSVRLARACPGCLGRPGTALSTTRGLGEARRLASPPAWPYIPGRGLRACVAGGVVRSRRRPVRAVPGCSRPHGGGARPCGFTL